MSSCASYVCKMLLSVLILLVLSNSITGNYFFRPLMKVINHPKHCDFGDPLILTPLLEKGRFKEAQHLSKVKPIMGNMTSYSGFFTVNKKCDSNLFFWFFPAQKSSWEDAPLLLWLQGGPGSSSMYGLFEELGPFKITEKGLDLREYSWNVENNLLFIDQPVGTGFSFTGGGCYPKNEDKVGEDLYQAIVQFYQLFPQLNKNKFYVSGESYAGHYIPALGHTIHKHNPSANIKIKLAAMIIGNGWIDPATQNDYGEYLYQLGLLGTNQRKIIKLYDNLCSKLIQHKKWVGASIACQYSMGYYFDKFVGSVSVYNYVQDSSSEMSHWGNYVQTCEARKSLKVGNLTFQGGAQEVYEHLLLDSIQSVKPWIEELLEVYPIVFYSGQLDIICAYPMSSKVINSLKWSGQERYLKASRSKWCVNQEQAGYIKGEHRLYDVLVRGAGHMVPADQPHWAYSLINSITSGTPDNPFHGLTICGEHIED